MRIGIDAFGCDKGRSGLGSYFVSFIKNLPDGPDYSFEIFGPEIDRYTYNTTNIAVSYYGINLPDTEAAERIWHMTSFGSCCRKRKYDAVLFPAGARMLPLRSPVPYAVIVQDIVSEFYETANDSYFSLYLKKRLRTVPLIIAASNYIKTDLTEKGGIDEKKIIVVHNGLDHDRFYPRPKNNESTILIQPFSIRRPYLIYASRIEHPLKNHVNLIHGFELFKQRTGLPHRLVLAGSDGGNSEEVHRAVLNSPVSPDIFLTGFFPPQNMPELYAGAEACIFPSVCEGVGLPVLEAMASGIPVACVKAGALPEIAGDSVMWFDSADPERIADAICSIVSNISEREGLISKAVERVQLFSWKETVAQTLRALATPLSSL